MTTTPRMRYGAVTMSFHWLTVLLVLATIPVAFAMSRVPRGDTQDLLYATHKALGLAILAIVILRLLWRVTHRPPPLPATLPAWQRAAATANHWALYVLLIVMGVSGYVFTVTGGFPVEILLWMGIDPVLERNRDIAALAQSIHHTAKLLLIALIAVHVAAALRHLMIDRDGIFQRMWPGG